MAGTFHRFGDLPRELRDQIWALAVRPACPGVHIFKLFDLKEARPLDITRRIVLDEDQSYNTYQLAIPDCDESNPSTYLIDGGLWTACTESRRVMERKFKNTQGSRLDLACGRLRAQEDAAATGYFLGDHGIPHYFTVLPHRDLFLFEVQNITKIDWGEIDRDIPIGSSMWGYQGRLNIALEYKPEWGLQLGKEYPHRGEIEIVETFIRMAIDSSASYNIWIVDSSLRRKHYVSASDDSNREEPQTFSGRSQQLVEVQLYDRDIWAQWGYIKELEMEEEDSDIYFNSMSFVRHVNMAATNHWQSDETSNSPPCSIGLLGPGGPCI